MNKIQTVKLILIISATVILSGCLSTQFFRNITGFFKSGDADESYREQTSNIKIVPLRKPESGERITIRDPDRGTEYRVKIGEVYTSASGKLCGRYTVEDEDSMRDSGLVCFEQEGEWIKVPLQLPVNN